MKHLHATSRLRLLVVFGGVLGLLCASDPAHAVAVSIGQGHVDLLPFDDGGTVGAAFYDFDLEQVVPDARLFVRDMQVVQPGFFGTTSPGFTTFGDFTLTPSADLGFTANAITVPGATHNLLYWDGEGGVAFGAPEPGDDLLLRRSSALNTALDGAPAAAAGFPIDTTSGSGTLHIHISFQVRGDGGAQPADGLYLISLSLTMPGLVDSAPVFFLFNADYIRDGQGNIQFVGDSPVTDAASQAAAVDWVLANLIQPSIPGDTDGDGDVDDFDLIAAIANFTGSLGPGVGGRGLADGDTDADADVDDFDLITMISGFTGSLAAPGPSVPEPGIAAVWAVAAVLLFRRRG